MTELELLAQKLNERVQQVGDSLSMGAAKSFDEYQKLVGTVAGLQYCIGQIVDILERQRAGDDDE